MRPRRLIAGFCAIKCQHRGADADYPAHSEQRENSKIINMSSPLAAVRLWLPPHKTTEQIVKKLMGWGQHRGVCYSLYIILTDMFRLHAMLVCMVAGSRVPQVAKSGFTKLGLSRFQK